MPISRRKFIKIGAFATTTLFLTDAFWIEKFFIEVNEFFIGSATPDGTNIKIVQLSDLHLQSVNYQLTQLTKKLNKLKPDLIVITGDAIDKAQNVSLLNDFLQLIDKDISKVAILGNWEYWGKVNLIELSNVYEANNCKLLVNETTQYSFYNKTIAITGVDDYVAGNADIQTSLTHFKKSDYHIILNHCPQYSEQISEKIKDIEVDFILSGHTHGGQINIFGFIPFLPQGSGKYVKGWYKENDPKLYVSKGIGTSMVSARFGARAEIAIFNLSTY